MDAAGNREFLFPDGDPFLSNMNGNYYDTKRDINARFDATTMLQSWRRTKRIKEARFEEDPYEKADNPGLLRTQQRGQGRSRRQSFSDVIEEKAGK